MQKRQATSESFAGNTTVIEVGRDLWLGSYRGNRIAIVPAP